MANLYQIWDKEVQGLDAIGAKPEQIEARRQAIAAHFENKARQAGMSSKDIYATIDKFDQYSRQKTTANDDGLTPDEREAARDDGSTILGLSKGGLKAAARGAKDALVGIASSAPAAVGYLSQAWSDVGENDPSELSAQLARKMGDVSHDMRSTYSDSTKQAKKDFWSPTGLAMGVGENLGQIVVSGGLVGGAGKAATLAAKGNKLAGLGAAATTGAGLAYGQGYGQGKENALEQINKTSNNDLYAGVVSQFDEWNKSGAKGNKPELVSLYEEAGGDLNKMKDLMAEDAGAWAGILTAATAPIAMGATAFMNRGVINEMAKQGAGNIITRNLASQTGARQSAEFANRVATGAGVASIAGQGLKIAGTQAGKQALEEGLQEGGEGYLAAQAGSLARGDKGVLNSEDWSNVGKQAAQGAAIGAIMGGGGSLLTMRDAINNPSNSSSGQNDTSALVNSIIQSVPKQDIPKQYQDSFNAFENAKQAEAQAQAAYEANPTPESEEALAQATDARLKANNQFSQYDAAFKQTFTEQEQQDLLANDLKGIAARAKLAEEAKQAELNSKAEQEALLKAQAEQQAAREKSVSDFQQSQKTQLEADIKREKLAEKQQLENTLVELAAENDTDSMLSMLEGYDKTEADKLFNNAFKTVETRTKEAEKAAKAKEAEATKQAQAKQKQSAFNADMSALYASNPNATYNDWKAVGKKHGITSAIDLASAWASARVNKTKPKDEQKPKNTETLALPAPSNVMVTDSKGNTTQTTENNVPKKQRNADISVPSGLSVDVSNAANTQRDRGVGSYSGSASNLIVRQDGKPFPTEQVAQQALTNKSTKKTKAKKNEPVISKETHTVVPVDGGYAIAPVEQVNSVVQQEAKVESKQESVQEQTDDITGQYTHSQFPDATATVTKTDKGYDVDWGDEVQLFTGKNALEKTKSALAKENFTKGKPKDDGDGGVTIEPMPKKPVSPTNTTQTTPNTTGEQIAQAMDKTAQAITEAAHNKVVERIKNGEEIVYKQPAAIERVKQDERYQVELNDKGHAVVKNVKDNNGNWVKQDNPVATESAHIENGKIEEVTGEVIRESLAKVDDKPINGRTMSLKEAKQWLLDSIDKAIATAKYETNIDVFGRNGEKNPKSTDYITFDVPNDGKFKVLNTIESLQRFKANIEKTKGFTENQKPVKPFSAPSENSPETTISNFLADGELENAYFFAENQDKPIKFGLNGKNEPLAYFLTEPIDLGNGIKGFVGLAANGVNKEGRKNWIVIEENSRQALGYGGASKQAAIKSAKERLSALKKEDLEGLASKITPINKTDEEMKADWLAKNNIKIDEQSNEEVNTKKSAEDSAKAEGDKLLKASNDESSTKPASIIKVDFPLEETVNAWQHSVRNPSEIAKSFKRTFEDFIEEAYNSALLQAETDLQKKVLEQASLKLQQDYIKRFNELNAARSGVVSSFIAGRNNFNGKQAESRGNSFDKVSQRFDNWLLESKYELSTAVQDARSPEQLAKIKAEKDAKAQKLQDKNDEFLRKVLDFKKGDDFTIGKNQYKVVRVNRNKDGMPISLTLEGEGLIKGIDDKISLFGSGMAYPTINDLREAVARVQKKDESELIPKKSDNEDLAPVEKAQQAKKDAFLNTEIDSQYGKVTKRQLIDNLINDGWTITTGWTEDKAKSKDLDAELERLKRTAPIGNSSHPDTVRLNELKDLAKESPHKEHGRFFFKETTYRLESPTGQLKQLSKTELDYVNEVLAKKEPQSVEAEQEQAKTEDKPAEKPSISDKQANREKIRITMLQATNREKALALAVKLTEEMPDMDYEITSELQSVIQHNKWLGIEIKMPKTPFKGDSNAEVKKSITQLQKAFDGTGYSFNLIGLDKNSVMGQLSFSKDFSTQLNYIRNSKDIWVLFDNNYSNAGSLEFLDPVAKAITKWLNGENVEPFMAGIDPNWDIQFKSIPRVIADKLSAAKEKGENSTSKASTLTESKTINDSKKEDSIQPTSKTPLLDKNNSFMDLVASGKATAEQFKQSFDDLFANKDAVIAELNTLTKDQLFKEGSYNIQYRYKNDKKSVIAEAVYREMIGRYSLGRGISYDMGKNSYENAVKKMVDDTDQSRLDDFAKEYKQMIDDRAKEITEKAEALKNPQTLEDYRNLVRSKMADGSTRQEAFLSLTPEQRIKYDELEAESTKETREAKKRALQSTVNTASQTTTGTIIETKHTRDGYDLFVVQLSDRLSTDDYKQVLSEAKRLGGWYSSFRGNGAIAGFQFKDKGSAEAFLALAGGDTTAAKEQIDAKIDAFEDNRSQTAVERLQAMADKLEEKANEELERDRKVNTARRARFAASAEFAARSQIALAKTMRNIADAISSGKAKFLDNIRMKTDVEALQNYISTAKDNEIRAKYKTYAEQEKRKGQPATVETADFATYPSYTLYRSDLAMLGRKLLEIEGLKKFGQQIMAVADDVSDAYLEFAKKNLHQVSRFSKSDSSLATFSSKDIAERSIRKSGLTGKAIVLQVKRGENIIILSPSEAINLKVWEGDADKRITLKREFGNDLVNAVGRRAGKNNNLLPYQFQLNYDKFKALSRMGIETPSEFRSALREFISLQEEATNNKVREMELAMVGRKNDGLDFFPTPQVITQQMIEAAEITPDMAVLEPSAGMGHIADMIRATGAEPDVIEMSGERRELLKEKGYHLAETNDFMDMQPRKFFTYGDVFRAPDGKEGVMRGSSGQRVMLLDGEGNSIGYYNRDELEGVRHKGTDSGYDRIIMNPPFSNRQDAEHVRHAYDLLKPNGRIVAIMGEGVFFGSDKKAVEFREWLDSVGGTSEKLPDNSFMDKSLPVNTGVNARMVVIDKQESNNQDTDNKPKFSQSSTIGDRTTTQVREKLIKRLGKRIIEQLESKGILKIHQSIDDNSVPKEARLSGIEGFYFNGTVHLIADNLTDETIIPTFVHELGGHKGFQEMMSPKAYELIMAQFNRLVEAKNPIALAAKQRAEQAEQDKARQKDEYLPYLITEQAKNEQATPQERNAVKRLIDHIVRAVKGWVVRTLSKYDATYNMSRRVSESLTPQDILYMAERMVGEVARKSNNNNDVKFSKAEQSQLDRLLAKADKMIAEQGKLLAPNGKPSKLNRYQWAQVRTDNFKNWFGDWENDPANASQVVDENGEPLVVYHGTTADFSIFDTAKIKRKAAGAGFYFTTDPVQRGYAEGDGANVMPVYLSIKNPTANPLLFRTDESYDGLIFPLTSTPGVTHIAVRRSEQIKSAIGNNGEFSPINPDIRFSRAEDKAKAAKDYVLDSVRISNEAKANLHAKAELGFWHKTLGTQLNTALKHKDFGRVYHYLQRLLQRTSSDVTDALEVAPTLLDKLDDYQDLKRFTGQLVSIKKVKDRMTVAKVLFGETLAKKPLTRTELEEKLTKEQIAIYEEARAAIEVSLKNTAKSELIRKLLATESINFNTVEQYMKNRTGFDEFIDEMLENVGAKISNAQEELAQTKNKVEQEAIKAEIAKLSEIYNTISDVNNKVYQLLDEGYMPLMRFGDYALTMKDKQTGKVLSFMMFETKAERNRMVNQLAREYGNSVELETDTMSQEEFKQFKGMTPETVALFAKELGLSKDAAYQNFLKLAIPATSALTRKIHRKGTAGYNEDLQRVVASFVMSNARYSAKNIYLAKVDETINAIESGKSVKDQAIKMKENTIDPVDTFAWLRDLLFVYNLGFSFMFGVLNLSQPYMQTIPLLSQYLPTTKAFSHLLKANGVAMGAMISGKAPKGYEAEYERAVHEGIVDPQNTFMLTGLERGGTGKGSKTWTATKHILGIIAQATESFNRKAVFVASLDVAKQKGDTWLKQRGHESAYDFAVSVVSQTQGVYNKANRSNWAHTQLGAPLLIFKQFSINYVEQMIRMWKNQNAGDEGKKAVFLMLLMLASLAGGLGLPFVQDILDVSEIIAAFLGNPVNLEREARMYLGKDVADPLLNGFINHYIIGAMGADVQSRTSMGNLIPGTAYFNSTLSLEQKTNEFLEVFGAAGGLGGKLTDALQLMANDEYGTALKTASPRFISSAWSGVEMMTTGKTMDSKGRTLFDATTGEAITKFFDGQPKRMAELSRARGMEYGDTAIQRSKIDYYRKKWIKAAMDEDFAKIEEIEQDIADWNEENEKYPVIFDRQRALKSANKNEMMWGERQKIPESMPWLREERPDFVRD